ncbi:glycosyltransferase family 4 protein [Cellvibrio sp. OA-2007]|uniref:glycosyltransferase family 4 protein n=1 Tax=Cellvibrio sp. OA-2007 TaxID=529823 RepID=UPI000780452C|nr:glycosyltransferase family 4 protein [Cellvibrio sp. OA-2007]
MNKKNILIFDQVETSGGSIARAVDLANELQDFRFIFITYHPLADLYPKQLAEHVIAKRIFSFYNYQRKSAHINRIKALTKNKLLTFFGLKLVALLDLINEYSIVVQTLAKTFSTKIDLVQANGGAHPLPYRIAEIKDAALLYYFRHLDDYRWAEGKMLARANDYIFVSANLMKAHLELLQTVPKDRCQVVHSPFDSQKLLAKAPPSNLQLINELKSKGYIVILHPARICHEKGQHIAIDAIIKIKDTYPNFALIFAGSFEDDSDNSYERLLKDKIQEHKLGERVLFIGHRNDVVQILQSADIALQTPIWFEALGGSLIEAMQLGVLTVSADIGGTSEAVIHQKTGLLFPPGNSDELARLLAMIAENQIDTKALAEAGKEHAYRNWGAELIQQKMRRIYSDAIATFHQTDSNKHH